MGVPNQQALDCIGGDWKQEVGWNRLFGRKGFSKEGHVSRTASCRFWMSSAGNGGDAGQPADLDRGQNAPAFENIPNYQIWCREPCPLLTNYVGLD